MENLEKYLLDEVIEKKQQIADLKAENKNLNDGLSSFRNVLISVVKKINIEEVKDSEEKKMSFGTFSSEEDKELYDVLVGFAKELGFLSNEQ